MTNTTTTSPAAIEWDAQQVCGECGEGVFRQVGAESLPLCTVCGHEHPMSRANLDECEEFYWAADGTLHVRAFAV